MFAFSKRGIVSVPNWTLLIYGWYQIKDIGIRYFED